MDETIVYYKNFTFLLLFLYLLRGRLKTNSGPLCQGFANPMLITRFTRLLELSNCWALKPGLAHSGVCTSNFQILNNDLTRWASLAKLDNPLHFQLISTNETSIDILILLTWVFCMPECFDNSFIPCVHNDCNKYPVIRSCKLHDIYYNALLRFVKPKALMIL